MAESTIGSRLELILDTMTDGVYVTTDEREIVYWSAGAERITGYHSDEVVGRHCYDNILVHTDLHGKQLCISGCPLESCIKTGKRHSVNEVFLMRKDGARLPVYVKTATFDEGGRTFGVEIFGELESVAGQDLASRVQELSETSVTDPLSSLFNRRYFDAALQQQYEMFERLGRRYGVMHIDIDNFKRVNDTLGHAAGDEAIQFIASVLSRNARKMDVIARYGGDEFAIICSVGTPEALRGIWRAAREHGARVSVRARRVAGVGPHRLGRRNARRGERRRRSRRSRARRQGDVHRQAHRSRRTCDLRRQLASKAAILRSLQSR